MSYKGRVVSTVVVVLIFVLVGVAQVAQDSKEGCPMHQDHRSSASAKSGRPDDASERHMGAVEARGDRGMGFDHATTTHHFLLFPDGGAIEVETNQANNTTSRDQIRAHLRHITGLFAEGNFSIPMFIHHRVPPGVDLMKKNRLAISYKYEALERGGRVRIATADARLIEAIHEFLKFQIDEHQTGDQAGGHPEPTGGSRREPTARSRNGISHESSHDASRAGNPCRD